jgi:hypothetical protein
LLRFQRCFVAWVAATTGALAETIAIDGKTVRRSYLKKGAKEPIHTVSAFAARQRLVLTSLAWLACQIQPVIRAHWAIESVPQTHTRRRFTMN